MATNKKNKINIQIDFSTNISALEDIKKNFEQINTNGKLVSKQGNTLKSTYNSIGSLFTKLSDYQKNNSTVTVSELKKIQTEYDKIKSSLQAIKETENLTYQKRLKQLKDEKNKTEELNNVLKKAEELRNDKQSAKSTADAALKDLKSGKLSYSLMGKMSNTQMDMYNAGGIDLLKSTAKTKKKDDMSALEVRQIDEAKQFLQLLEEEIELHKQNVKLAEDELKIATSKLNTAQDNVNNNINSINTLTVQTDAAKQNVEDLTKLEEQLAKGHQAVSQQTNYLVKSGEKQAEVTDKIESKTTKLIKTGLLYRAVVNGVRKILNESVKAVIEMDKALTDMSIVTGESREELYALVPTLNKLGQECGATSTEMASLTAEYMKQGRTMRDSLELAEQTAKAAKIAGISVSDSVQYMTSAINGFNLAATDAEHVSDIFAKVGAATATDYEQLAVALSKVSAQANTAGLSIEFTTALLAKGIETTQEAPESIGTALKTVFARMRELTDYGSVLEDDTSINKVERALASAGVALRNTNGEFRDLEEVFKELGPQWDNLNTMQQQAIAQAVAGTRQQSRFLAIMQDWDRTLEISTTTLDSAGASAYQFSQYAKSLEHSITNLKTSWQGLVATFTDTDVIKGGIDLISKILNAITDIMNIGDGFVGNVTAIIGLFTAGLLTVQKWRLTQLQQLDTMIEQVMVSKQLTKEEALLYLKENKRLTLSQKILTLKEKEYQLSKKQNKNNPVKNLTKELNLNKQQSKSLQDIVDKNKDLKDYSDRRTSAGKELAKFAKENNLNDEQRLAMAQQLNLLNNKDLAVKAAEAGLDAASVAAAQSEALAKGIQLSEEEAITVAKIKSGGLSVKEAIEQGLITKEKAIQLGLIEAENIGKLKGIALSVKQKAKDLLMLPIRAAGALLESIISMGLPAGAIVGGAIIAGIAGIVGGTVGSVAAAANKQKKVSENQETIYENKEKTSSLTNLKNEYEELLNKKNSGMATTDELNRMEEIEEELKEIDKDLEGSDNILLGKIEEKLGQIKEDTSKLVTQNKQNVVDLASDYNAGDFWSQAGSWLLAGPLTLLWRDAMKDAVDKKQVSNVLGKEENQLALRQAASHNAQEANMESLTAEYGEEKATTIMNKALSSIDSLYADMDWEEFSEKYYDDVENKINKLETLYTNAALDIAEQDTLANSIGAYKDNLAALTAEFGEDSDIVDDFQKQYAQYNNLKDFEDTIRTLEASGNISGGQILGLVSSLNKLGISSNAVGKALEELANSEKGLQDASAELVDEMISKRYDTSTAGIKYWAELTGQTEEQLQQAVKEGKFDSLVGKLIDHYQELATGGITSANIKEYRDRVTSSNDKRSAILEELAEGKLSTESKDYLSEYFGDLYADPTFQKAVAEGSAEALTMFKEAAKKDTEDITNGSKVLLAEEEDEQKLLLAKHGFSSYEDFLKSGGTGDDDVDAIIKSNQINIQNIKDSIKEMESLDLGVEKIDEYASALNSIDAEIASLEGKTDMQSLKRIQELYEDKAAAAQNKFNETLEKTASAMGMSVEDLNQYYKIIDGKLIPDAEKLNSLDGEKRLIWLNNEEALSEYCEAQNESLELAEEQNQVMVDAALEAQDYFIEMYKSKLEKENEALQESLDKRAEAYEKYFDSLEDEEESADYETERQKLINRIASLSTATDSASLTKLKEAQQELADLNKDRATSQRELRREAVAERFEEQKAEADKKLQELTADGNAMLAAIYKGFATGEFNLVDLAKQSGTFEGMTTLGISNWLKEGQGMYSNFLGYQDTTSIMQGLLSPFITGLDGIVNNNSSASASIVNNINLVDKLNDPVQKATFEKEINEFFNELLIRWGLNPNANPY